MERHRYHPTPGVSSKLYHVVDAFNDSTTYWDPLTGLTALDPTSTPQTEEELIDTIVAHFHRSDNKKSIYIPLIHRQHLKIEELEQRVRNREKILLLEIDVEEIMPDAKIFPVRDIIAGREGPWRDDPREDEWMDTYLVLHRVPRSAITVHDSPEGFLTKEREDQERRRQAVYHEIVGPFVAPKAAESPHPVDQGPDVEHTK